MTGGKGARVVFDLVGRDGINALAQATPHGGIFMYGMLSGQPTPFPMAAFGRRVAMFGCTFNELRNTPDWDSMKAYIYDHLADGSFKPEIARTFPFAHCRGLPIPREQRTDRQAGHYDVTAVS